MRFFSGRCYSKIRLDGKTAVVTGCNTGIGKETVLDFYRRGKDRRPEEHLKISFFRPSGARVIMACRNLDKAEEAAKDIRVRCKDELNTGEIVTAELNLSSLKSVKDCAQKLNQSEDRIDLLINNAGIMVCPETRTEDGYELQFQTNHLGHFLLTVLLLPKIINSAPARIVNVSSLAHILSKSKI